MTKGENRGWKFKWTPKEDSILEKYYSAGDLEELQKLLPNRNIKAIYSRAHKLGIKYPKKTYDIGYFNNIDTPTKAYWLVFLYADGFTTKFDKWGIELQINDRQHLQCLADELCYNGDIYGRKRKNTETCKIEFKNKQMTDSLIEKGVVPCKTEVLEFPSEEILKPLYYKDFIRGFFDGDGCITVKSNTRPRKDRGGKIYTRLSKEVYICCKSKRFIDQLNNILNANDIYFNLYVNSTHNNLYYLRTSKLDTIRKFFDYIYDWSEEKNRLNRKYEKFISLFDRRCA